MKRIAVSFVICASALTAQTARITGTVTDERGAPLSGARVSASLKASPKPVALVPGRPPAFMPVQAKSDSGTNGEFQIEGLLPGLYRLCVQKPGGYLDPCLWADQPVTVELDDGATVSGAAVVARKGGTVTVRVQDPTGTLAANPAASDLRVGVHNGNSPLIPALPTNRDANGQTLSVVVPQGKSVTLVVSSAKLALADATGAALKDGENQIVIPAANIPVTPAGVGAPEPTLTIQVLGAKAK